MTSNSPETIFVGDSEMARLMRSHFSDRETNADAVQLSLGPVSSWPSSLKTAVSICLNSRFPMVIWWGNDLVLLYNDAWCPILGTKHPKALGRPGREVWAEIWDIIGVQLHSVLDTAQATWSDDMLLSVDRYGYTEEAYFTYSYSPIFLETGEVGGAFTAVTETTRRVIGERRLRTLRELAASTVEAKSVEETCRIASATLANNPYDIPFALLYLIEPDGRSARLAQSIRVDAASLAGLQQVDLSQTSDCWNFTQVRQTGQAAVIKTFASFGALPGGAWDTPSHTAIALPIVHAGQKNHLTGFLVLGISPRREFDDEYRGFFELVASNVATAIANAQAYEEERKRAEALAELDRAKTTFFSNVSHEFRTPLTLMLGPLEETLNRLDSKLPSPEREQLEMVHRNGLRLLKLVNTLLDFSRIEAGRIHAVYEPTDLAEFTAELASVFRAAIEQAGVSLRIKCPPLPEPIYVDREMWEKIILNLLSNAFKFTFEGEISVALHSCKTYAELTVQDTGIGIPVEELPHIFERFHRVRGAQGRSYEGSGIGLALVQELVHLHGGTIEVRSVVGQGTCFTLCIPTGTAHLPVESIQAARTLPSTATGAAPYIQEILRWLPNGSKDAEQQLDHTTPLPSSEHLPAAPRLPYSEARILLVDDNADMREYVQRLLSQRYQVETVANGIAALAAIQRRAPDLVLADVMMPGLDGFGLLRELRSRPWTQELPIILLSARAGEEARIEGLEAGADDYLIKPFTARELLARVEANLKLAQLRQDTAQREQSLRLQAENAQQAVETILSSIRDGFYTLDRNWCFTYANDRLCEIAGKHREELLGYNNWELFPQAVGTDVYIQFHRAMETQTPVQFEYLYLPWDRWFEYRVYPSLNGLTIFIVEVTDRKQAEAIIREDEERLKLAVEAARMVAWEWNPHHNTVITSSNLSEIYGVAVIESAEQGLSLVHPEDRARHQAIVEHAVATCRDYLSEFRLTRPDTGAILWMEERGQAILNSDGSLQKLIGITIDMTERKQAEAALRQSEAKLRLTITAARMVAWDWNVSTDQIAYSETACDILGLSPDALNGSSSDGWALVHPDDRPLHQANVEAAIANQSTYVSEFRMIRPDTGAMIWIEDRGQVACDRQGNMLSIEGILFDITARKQAEIALHQSEERLRMALSVGRAGIWDWDISANQVTWSEQIYQFHGLTPSTFGGRVEDFAQLIYPDDRAPVSEAMRQALEGKKPYKIEFRTVQPGGEVRWLSTCGGVIFDAQDQPIRMLGATQDITDRKQAEAEREELLAREQAARAAAEQANRIKDEFLAIVSHELRSPLNPILGWSTLLQSQRLDPAKTAQALDTIARNAKLQAELIEDLLDVSRILRGKLSLSVRPVNLTSTIEAALETVQLSAEAKAIQIHTYLDRNIGVVSGDISRLQQVVWNLLSNAIKFTPEGGRVTVTLEQVALEQARRGDEWRTAMPSLVTPGYAQITVSDTGKGIHPSFLPHVFDYFRQEDGATTRKFGGLGLGLAIVHHLVELHGGTIEANSPGEGRGATFTVRLPLMKIGGRTIEDVTDVTRSLPSISVPLPLHSVHVLVVDDDADTRDFVAFLLEQAGANVSIATSADEALAMLSRTQPDVLVSDIGMPGTDGYTLLRRVRALSPQEGSGIPAIALTAYAGEYDQHQALAAGFQQHISKPIEPETLVQAIASLLAPIT